MRRLELLVRLFDNPDPIVRLFALSRMEEVNADFEVADLIDILEEAKADSAKEVRHQARRSLAHISPIFFADRYAARRPSHTSRQGTWTEHSIDQTVVRAMQRAETAARLEPGRVDWDSLLAVAYGTLSPALERVAAVALQEDDPHRSLAILALGKYPRTQSVDALADLACREETAAEAASALADIGTSEALDALLGALDELKDAEIYPELVVELGVFEQPEALQRLVDAGRSERTDLRLRVALAFRDVRRPEAVDVLKGFLEKDGLYVELFALAALARVGGADAAEAVRRCLVSAKVPLLRSEALRAYGAVAAGQDHGPVVEALTDGSPVVRAQAIEALVRLKVTGRELADRVEPLLRDPEPSVRAAAVLAIAPMDHATALQAVSALLKRPDARSRAEAAWCLGYIHGEMALHALEHLLDTAGPEMVTLQAVKALAHYPSTESFPILLRCVRHPHAAVRRVAARILATSRFQTSPSSVGRFRQCIESEEDAAVRRALVAALANLATPTQSLVVSGLLETADPQLRAAVVETLDLLGAMETLPCVERLMASRSAEVRAQAALFLWHEGEISVAHRLEDNLSSKEEVDVSGALSALIKVGHSLRHLPGSRSYPLLVGELVSQSRVKSSPLAPPAPPKAPPWPRRRHGESHSRFVRFAPPVAMGEFALPSAKTGEVAGRGDELETSLVKLVKASSAGECEPLIPKGRYLVEQTGSSWARFVLARLLEGSGMAREAEAELEAATDGAGDVVPLRLWMARLAGARGDREEAKEQLEAALRRAIELHRRSMRLDMVALEEAGPDGDWALAYDAAARDGHLLSDAHYRLGRCHLRRRAFMEAFVHLFWAYLAAPEDDAVSTALARAADATGRRGLGTLLAGGGLGPTFAVTAPAVTDDVAEAKALVSG